ncbi:glycosyltransferase involved in cell wall biosynthesis [Kribbella sp. VKM Ac-2569]|uniref:glycosyltransferase family 2 protein n=1 Tax=Kribbella sp. VKM Ac-2569 TaxID=2512220 RepID=UPI00102C1A61|nr:glycosyltransferase family 2 protein [Kribbella sp. VKM Ac-2569]RZT26857.1 glycosyltransferase involved in cell wall biosynthesis [Kribbella sp. VKM Ac-2569]
MKAAPRLTVGLPVYNGEEYLAQSLDALLGQSYTEFELIISDNASEDSTQEICRDYAARDERISYVRQPVNIGAGPNHNFVFTEGRGELHKWASHDDLYGRDLLLKCVEALDENPDVVLAHAWQAIIDPAGRIVLPVEYPLATDDPRPSERFRSMLFAVGGDDFYGVIRSDVIRRTPLHDSYHHADRTFVTEIGLHGPFYQVPEQLFFRRDHPGRAERARPNIRARSANMDPRRANRLRNPVPRLLVEYVWGFVSAIRRAPLSSAERRKCYQYLALWMASRMVPGSSRRIEDTVLEPEAGVTR